MKYRELGRTGLLCSEVGLGSWSFASQVYGGVEESDALETIHAALDSGVNFFDTAPLYGTKEQAGVAEEILGRGLSGRRAEVFISTKFGRNSTKANVADFTKKAVLSSVEKSLSRLKTDYVDILFFHSPFSPDEIHDDVWEGLTQLKQNGKVRFVGHSISMFPDTQQMARDWARERKIDVIQVVLSLLNREATKLIWDLGNESVGIVARESLANGFLSGSVTRDTVFPEGHLNARYSGAEIVERVVQVEKLEFLVRRDIKSLPQAAMRWVLDNRNVSVVLSGARNAKEILECAAASDAESYSLEELERAELVHGKDFQAA